MFIRKRYARGANGEKIEAEVMKKSWAYESENDNNKSEKVKEFSELLNDLSYAFLFGPLKVVVVLLFVFALTLIPATILFLGWNFVIASIFKLSKVSYITAYSIAVLITYMKTDISKAVKSLQTTKIFSFLLTRQEEMENLVIAYMFYAAVLLAIAPFFFNIFWDTCLANIVSVQKPGYIGIVVLFIVIRLIFHMFFASNKSK